MSTRYHFSQEQIEQFEQTNGLLVGLTREQYDILGEKEGTALTHSQLYSVAEKLAGNQTLEEFVNALSNRFQPLSISLFVFNDAIWKLMERKIVSPDTMLPMATVPYFYWKMTAITQNNPYGVMRDPTSRSSLSIEPNHSVALWGTGGEFCGILEGQLADRNTGPRPIISPTLPGSKEKVPKYESQDIGFTLQFGNLKADLYPDPWKTIDYTFSEHPKVFYEHGLAVTADGKGVKLKVSNKRSQPLHGDVYLLLGKRWESETPGQEIVLFHVWLNALSYLLK